MLFTQVCIKIVGEGCRGDSGDGVATISRTHYSDDGGMVHNGLLERVFVEHHGNFFVLLACKCLEVGFNSSMLSTNNTNRLKHEKSFGGDS